MLGHSLLFSQNFKLVETQVCLSFLHSVGEFSGSVSVWRFCFLCIMLLLIIKLEGYSKLSNIPFVCEEMHKLFLIREEPEFGTSVLNTSGF